MPNQKPPPPPNRGGGATFTSNKTLTTAANLSNILPTGTVLLFQTLKPPFSNKGICQSPNKYLTIILITFCSVNCFVSSFTDSFIDSNKKLHYGIATFNGLYIFNRDNQIRQNLREENLDSAMDNHNIGTDLSKFKIALIDFVHAIVSLLVFVAFAFSDGDVQKCVLGGKGDWVVMKLPMVAGVLASVLFVIFPTVRRGIGYGEMTKRLR